MHGKIGTYGELRKALSASTPQKYVREEISLTPSNVVLLVRSFEGEVNNGGIDQFFFNSAGNYFQETIDALEIIGAKKTADVLRRAGIRFPNGNPSTNLYKRRDVMLSLVSPNGEAFNDLDQEFYRYEDDLYNLIGLYETTVGK